MPDFEKSQAKAGLKPLPINFLGSILGIPSVLLCPNVSFGMGFTCEVCGVEKRAKEKRNATTCLDCYRSGLQKVKFAKIEAVQVQLSSKEDLLEKKEQDILKREMVLEGMEERFQRVQTLVSDDNSLLDQKRIVLLLKEQEVKVRFDQLEEQTQGFEKLEKEMRIREEKLLEKEKEVLMKEAKMRMSSSTKKLGRTPKVKGTLRKRKPFSNLQTRRKQAVVSEGIESLKKLSGGNVKEYLQAINQRIFGERNGENQGKAELLTGNVKMFCRTYLHKIPEKARGAAMLTQGMTLKEGELLTGQDHSSIAWGKNQIKQGKLEQTRVS